MTSDLDLNLLSDTNFQFSSIEVAPGVTLTVPSGTTLRSSGNITIGGTIMVGYGAQCSQNLPTLGIALSAPSNGTGGSGMGSAVQAAQIGRSGLLGGGAGLTADGSGQGGGKLTLLAAGIFQLTGSVIAKGQDGAGPAEGTQGNNGGGYGGGGGGVIIVAAKTGIAMIGQINVNGGAGGQGVTSSETIVEGDILTFSGGGGGGGGGGIIHLLGPSISAGALMLKGGMGGGGTSDGANGSKEGLGGGGSGGNGASGGYVGSNGADGSPGVDGFAVSTITSTPENLLQ